MNDLPSVGGDEAEWLVVSTSGEYYVPGLTVMHALANFYADHPWNDDVHGICVQGSFQDGFRWSLEFHDESWCRECHVEGGGHKMDCATGRGSGGERVMRIRQHRGFGHGLAPGTDHNSNCLSCEREKAEGIEPVIEPVTEAEHDAECGGPELRAAEKFEQDNSHDKGAIMASTKPRTRVHTWLSWEATGEDGKLPPSFELIRHTEHQRRFRGMWYRDSSVPEGYRREAICTLTRDELATHIAESATALSWPAN